LPVVGSYQRSSSGDSPRFRAPGPVRSWVRLNAAGVGSPYPGADTQSEPAS
jgi:hypothetical protein